MTRHWMFVVCPEHFELSRSRGFDVAGVKSRFRKKSALFAPGDRVLYYLTGAQAIGGSLTICSEVFEDHERIWTADKPDEDYPFRVRVTPDVIRAKDEYAKVAPLVPALGFLRKWPTAHWHLGFQGNLHELPAEDFALLEEVLRQATDPAPLLAH